MRPGDADPDGNGLYTRGIQRCIQWIVSNYGTRLCTKFCTKRENRQLKIWTPLVLSNRLYTNYFTKAKITHSSFSFPTFFFTGIITLEFSGIELTPTGGFRFLFMIANLKATLPLLT